MPALLLPLLLTIPTTIPADAAQPHVVMILADDLGFGDLGCYGATDLRSPHLDRLASEGQRWTQFYANCPVCSPTRAALMSGRYQDLVGVPGVIRTHAENSWGDLLDGAELLPERLKAAGYRTACIGKWHLGLERPDRPQDRGFDRFHGFLGDMMDDYYSHRRHGINYMRLGEQTIDPKGHATDLFTDWAIDELETAAKRDEPLFLYLAYNAPHTPIQPPDDWVERVRSREPQLDEKRAKLVALIEHMDDGIGRVLSALERLELQDETIVVFSSDNGGQSSVGANNGPHRAGKGTVYEGGLAVPTILRVPGLTTPGSECATAAMTMDLTATIADLARVEFPEKIDGVSLVPSLAVNEQPPLRTAAFFRRREGGAEFNGQTIDAVRVGRWKLLQNRPTQPLELYDLESDPLEETDRWQTAPKPVRRMLLEALAKHRQRCGAVPWQGPDVRDLPIEPVLPTAR